MQCHQVQEMLSTYLDGMLIPSEQDRLEAHLQQCALCQSELEFLKVVIDLVQDLPPVHPSAEFRQGLWQKLSGFDADTKNNGVFYNNKILKWKWTGFAAMAASFLLVIGLAAGWNDLPFNKSVNTQTKDLIQAEQSPQKNTSPEVLGGVQVSSLKNNEASEPRNISPGTSGKVNENKATDSLVETPLKMAAQNVQSQEGTTLADSPVAMMSRAFNSPSGDSKQLKQVIVEVDVADQDQGTQAINTILRDLGGKPAGQSEAGSAALMMEIPESNLEKALTSITGVGTVIKHYEVQDDGLAHGEQRQKLAVEQDSNQTDLQSDRVMMKVLVK